MQRPFVFDDTDQTIAVLNTGGAPPGGGCNKVAVLGTGTYGIVESYRLKDGTDYAVKTATKGFRQADLREISMSRYLGHHPCIIDVLAVGFRQEGKLYMVMEQGIDVRKYMRLGPGDPDRKKYPDLDKKFTLSIIYQLACGVDYMHSKGVMHRDLKPDNMLIFPDGSVKICDFGLAKALSCVEGTGMTREVLTIYYKSIEVLLGGRYDQSVDIWSIGCIIYEICMNSILFRGATDGYMINLITRKLGPLKREEFDPLVAWDIGWYYLGKNAPSPMHQIQEMASLTYLMPFTSQIRHIVLRCLTYDAKKRITAKELVADSLFDSVRNKTFEVRESDRKNCIELLELSTFARRNTSITDISPDISIETELILKVWMADEVRSLSNSDPMTYFYAVDLLTSTIPKDMKVTNLRSFGCGCLMVASMMKEIYPFDAKYLAGQWVNHVTRQ
jgi:serine/threonine protein kinase